ncbi:hypothetical protein CTV99_12445 [Bacillus pumilus]|uniref:Uncharacterized protein n=1 Tax=Bacillus pumilus TaxID=1408 RepID=A0A2G8ISE9_BACPU|nr:hypothetical protein CTV99_12445 [Bacillus pumilus]
MFHRKRSAEKKTKGYNKDHFSPLSTILERLKKPFFFSLAELYDVKVAPAAPPWPTKTAVTTAPKS